MQQFDDATDEEAPAERPRTRRDCLPGGINEARPCPFVGCRHSLALDLSERGHLLLRFDPSDDEGRESCALDVADRDGLSVAEVAEILGITQQGARAALDDGLRKLGPFARETK